ncbi:MAG: hypothetical protein R2681_01650 [Pyrinomonadaceae bacterium]
MNYAHIHLILNHIPVIGIGFGILFLAYGFFTKSDEVKKLSLIVFVISAVVAIPVYLTGEPAEEIVENLAGVSKTFIDQHEDAAFYALILMEMTGVIALLNLFFFSGSFAKKFLIVTSLSAITAAAIIFWTANLGGKIRHTEISADSTQTANPEKKAETEHEDDDEH